MISKKTLRNVTLGLALATSVAGIHEIFSLQDRTINGDFNKASACEMRQKIFEGSLCSAEELANIKERDAAVERVWLGGALGFAGLGLAAAARSIKP